MSHVQKKTTLHADISKKYFARHLPLVLVAMPQLREHNILPATEDDRFSKNLVEAVASIPGCNVLLSLHPKMKTQEYLHLEECAAHVHIAKDERLSTCLPAADMFISCFQSTLYWAPLCGVLPVFLDYFEMGYDFQEFKSFQVLRCLEAMQKDLQHSFKNRAKFASVITADAEKLGPFDGKSHQRILDILNS